jgi:hypothetical protein
MLRSPDGKRAAFLPAVSLFSQLFEQTADLVCGGSSHQREANMSSRRIKRGRSLATEASSRTWSGAGQILACEDCGCGLVTFAVPLGDTSPTDFRVYMDAHRLLPYEYDYDAETCGRIVAQAVVALADERVDINEQLRAIAVLGHSPCAEAVAALGEVASSGSPLAGVAELALGECQGMAEAFGIPLGPIGRMH